MKESQMRRGFRKAMKFKGMKANAVCHLAGVGRNLLSEYLRDPDKDIYVGTVIKLCERGLGMSFNEVWILGQMK